MPENRVIVTLSSFEDEMATLVGTRRHYANAHKADRKSYDAKRLEVDNCQASIQACRAEIGVAKAYGAYWDGSIWHHTEHRLNAQNPDLHRGDMGIEVKRRRSANVVPIDRKDAERGRLIVWAQVNSPDSSNPFPRVWIIGEINAAEAWDENAEPYYGDNNRRGVPRSILNKPSVRSEYASQQGDNHDNGIF